MRRLWAAVAALAAAASTAVPLARADDAPLPPTSAVSQYVEQLPSATGPTSLGGAAGSEQKTKPLAPTVRRAIARDGGSDATVLEQVATNPSYGAPAHPAAAPPAKPKPHTSRSSKGVAAPPTGGSSAGKSPAAPSAASAAVSTAGSSGVWPLAFALLTVTAAAAGLRLRRH